MSFAIAIPTRNRELQLQTLLEKLFEQMSVHDISCDVFVLNTGLKDYSTSTINKYPLIYRHLPLEGFSSARNYLLDWVEDQYKYLIMIDDDEYPEDKWLSEMISTIQNSAKVAIIGPVLPDFGSYSGWKIHLKHYYHNQFGVNPTNVSTLSCGNVTLNLEVMKSRVHRPYFDEKFNLSGGEDTAFARLILKFFGNDAIMYNPNAIVYEQIPDERLRLVWMFRKHQKIGQLIYMSREHLTFSNQVLYFLSTVVLLVPKSIAHAKVNFEFNIRAQVFNIILDLWKVCSYGQNFLYSLVKK